MTGDLLEKLADLVVGFGANVQPGQVVGVTSFVGREEATRAVARAAYRRGARYVDVVTFDDRLKRERLLHAPLDSLEYVPPWLPERLRWLYDGAPDLPEKVTPGQAAQATQLYADLYNHAAPFSRQALARLWQRCEQDPEQQQACFSTRMNLKRKLGDLGE